ncbi:MAG: AAA family ATPase [Candidatus Paceibacterota bacterium]
MILGITGTNGAGKGTVVDYLVEKKGFNHYSSSGFITEEIVRREMPINRDSMRIVGNDLRQLNSPSYVVETNYGRALAAGGDAVLDSVRTIGESEFLKSKNVPIIAVDADRKTRYERVVVRGSAKDKVSFEEFCIQEDKEMAQTAANEMNIGTVMKMADYTLHNDGTLEDLHAQIEEMLSQLV